MAFSASPHPRGNVLQTHLFPELHPFHPPPNLSRNLLGLQRPEESPLLLWRNPNSQDLTGHKPCPAKRFAPPLSGLERAIYDSYMETGAIKIKHTQPVRDKIRP